jgi:hypothetical protein
VPKGRHSRAGPRRSRVGQPQVLKNSSIAGRLALAIGAKACEILREGLRERFGPQLWTRRWVRHMGGPKLRGRDVSVTPSAGVAPFGIIPKGAGRASSGEATRKAMIPVMNAFCHRTTEPTKDFQC